MTSVRSATTSTPKPRRRAASSIARRVGSDSGAPAPIDDGTDRPTPAQQWVCRVLPPRGADLPPWLVGVVVLVAMTVGGAYFAARYGWRP